MTTLEKILNEFEKEFHFSDAENPAINIQGTELHNELVAFLTKVYEQARQEVVEIAGKLGKEQIELYSGKLPFVVFGGKASESEKIAIYRQALSDVISSLKDKSV